MWVRVGLMVVSCVLSVVIGLTLASRGAGEIKAEKRGVTIGLSMDTLKEARWQADRDLFLARAEELGAKVLVQSANSDDARQIQDVESLISSNVDVLVIIPHNGAAMAKAVDMARQANIPTLAYDRMITNCDLDLYMSFDNIKVGEQQARYLIDNLPNKGKRRIVRIYGAKTDNNALLFKQGQDNILQPYIQRGDVTVLHDDWADDWKPENAKKITNAAITKHGAKFDAILASNDGTAGGAIQALQEEGLAGKILVTGQDAELVACQRIAGGTQAMTIYKPLKTLARRAAEVAVQLAQRKPIIARDEVPNGKCNVPSVLCEVMTVDKKNLVETVIKDGFQNYDDVYRGVPEAQRPPKP